LRKEDERAAKILCFSNGSGATGAGSRTLPGSLELLPHYRVADYRIDFDFARVWR